MLFSRTVLPHRRNKTDDAKDTFMRNYPRNVLGTIWNMLLGDFSANICREDILNWPFGTRVYMKFWMIMELYFATLKNLLVIVKSPMLRHRNIYYFTWTSRDVKANSQIYRILVDRRRHSCILDVRSFRGAEYDADHYLVDAEVWERLS
jgi:hypothetical protein